MDCNNIHAVKQSVRKPYNIRFYLKNVALAKIPKIRHNNFLQLKLYETTHHKKHISLNSTHLLFIVRVRNSPFFCQYFL